MRRIFEILSIFNFPKPYIKLARSMTKNVPKMAHGRPLDEYTLWVKTGDWPKAMNVLKDLKVKSVYRPQWFMGEYDVTVPIGKLAEVESAFVRRGIKFRG